MDKEGNERGDLLGELIERALEKQGYRDEMNARHWIIGWAIHAICELIIRDGKFTYELNVQYSALKDIDDDDDGADWWKQSRYSRN